MKSRGPNLRSVTEGLLWPALPTREGSDLLALLYQLEQSEWLEPEAVEARQLAQLAVLVRHAAHNSPFYHERFAAAGLSLSRPWTREELLALPLLTRAELQARAAEIDARSVPAAHGTAVAVQTSGSTGQVVSVKRTALCRLFWLALTLREHLWHGRDFSRTLAAIRANAPVLDDDDDARRRGWGPPVSLLYESGPSYALPLSTDVGEQARWLERRKPAYLITYPTNLAALLDHFERRGEKLEGLLEVRTIGETLTLDLRERCRAILGVPLVDNYSSQEVGVIALECPGHGLYHVQSESLIVEVLDEQGRPCQPGEIGRVVVTDLHNFATPLVRYELRDYAEVGPPCPCGRGLPTLARILGRQRNMVVLPDGRRHWPLVGLHRYREVGPILQYQLVQHSLEDVEMRLVTGAPFTREQEARLTAIVTDALGHAFPLRFSYFEHALPGSRGGKFEEFVCRVGSRAPASG